MVKVICDIRATFYDFVCVLTIQLQGIDNTVASLKESLKIPGSFVVLLRSPKNGISLNATCQP